MRDYSTVPEEKPEYTIGDFARANVLAGRPATADLPGYQIASAAVDARQLLIKQPQPTTTENIDDAMDKLNYSNSLMRDKLKSKLQAKGQ